MRTFTFEETFDLNNPMTLTKSQADTLGDQLTCGISGEKIVPGEALVKLLIPSETKGAGRIYNEVVAKVDRVREQNWRFFRGETPRVALPEEINV